MAETTRRTLIADAVIATLAENGSRGLTHRAVDQAAGLPVGSTSYYLRSRAALLEAAVVRLADLDTEAVRGAGPADTVAAITDIIQAALNGIGRTRTIARYELSLEAVRRPELRRSLSAGTARLESALADRLERELRHVDPLLRARDLLSFVDGMLFAEVTGTGGAVRSPDEIHEAVKRFFGTPDARE